jgi:hypothetical protein
MLHVLNLNPIIVQMSFPKNFPGIQFIESNFTSISDDNQQHPIGFAIIFPSLIEYAQPWGINLPIGSTSL